MAKKKRGKRAPGDFHTVRLFFWFLLVIETLWLGAFIWSARSPFPPALAEDARERWQEHNDNKQLEEMLGEKSDR